MARALISRLRDREWAPAERAAFIAALTITMGSLFLTTYTLALGDPVPHRIDAALVGTRRGHERTLRVLEQVARGSLRFRTYASLADARRAIDRQQVYAAVDLTSPRTTVYISTAAGASVAHVLERIASVDPNVRVVDAHPLAATDPSGIDVFYLMLIATIVGFLTVFQVRANARGLQLRHWSTFVVVLALAGSLALTVVVGPLLGRLDVPVVETWGILALHIVAVASFTSVMAVLFGRWAILPTWLFFIVLGNSSSGGVVAPPLLPAPFAFFSQWLPSGATVTSLRNAVYFFHHQHIRPLVVLGGWAALLFGAMAIASHRRGRSPGT